MKAFVLISVRAGEIRQVVDMVRRIEGVEEAYMTFGPYDVVVAVRANDIAHLGVLLSSKIQPVPGVVETLTCLAVE